jgi:hypothetical protein
MADIPEWEPRVRVLEEIARSTDAALGEIRAELRGLRTEIGGLRSEMGGEIGGLRSEMGGEIGGLRSEIGALRSETRTDINGLRAAMQSQFHWLLGIIIATLLAQAALWLRIGMIGAEVSQIAALLHQHFP